MRTLRWVALGCLVLVIAGCGSGKNQDLIVGKWEAKQSVGGKEITLTTEFAKDGKMKVGMGPITMEGKYKFVDDNNIEVEMEMMGQKKTEKNKIETLTKEKMVLVDPQGKKQEFTRAK
jgi:uncharacterized protein (TIGR03066 family)